MFKPKEFVVVSDGELLTSTTVYDKVSYDKFLSFAGRVCHLVEKHNKSEDNSKIDNDK